MTLTSHAIVGAGLASIVPSHPGIAFVVGFGSHFLLDSIPHWDYQLGAVQKDAGNFLNNDMVMGKKALFDLFKVACDGLLGLALGYAFFGIGAPNAGLAIACGAIGGMTPDALQFVYWKWRHWPLTALQKFHHFMHARSDFNDKPLIGVPFQVIFVAASALLLKLL